MRYMEHCLLRTLFREGRSEVFFYFGLADYVLTPFVCSGQETDLTLGVSETE